MPEFDDDVVEGLSRRARDVNGKPILVPQNMTYAEWKKKYIVKDELNILNNVNISDNIKSNKKEVKDVQYVGNLDKEKLGQYKDKLTTNERLNEHILVKHKKEYEQLTPYLKDIIIDPDYILEDNKHDTYRIE